MEITTFLTSYWDDMVKKNRTALPKYFHQNATIYLHDTNEILNTASWIDDNCNYNGNWKATVDRVDKLENGQVVTITFLRSENWKGFVTSFFTLTNDLIIELHEYYAECEEIPQWRTDLSEHELIK